MRIYNIYIIFLGGSSVSYLLDFRARLHKIMGSATKRGGL